MKYILISFSEDGEKDISVHSQESIQEFLDELIEDNPDELNKFMTAEYVQQKGTDYVTGYLLIKGDSVIPGIKEVVKKASIE